MRGRGPPLTFKTLTCGEKEEYGLEPRGGGNCHLHVESSEGLSESASNPPTPHRTSRSLTTMRGAKNVTSKIDVITVAANRLPRVTKCNMCNEALAGFRQRPHLSVQRSECSRARSIGDGEPPPFVCPSCPPFPPGSDTDRENKTKNEESQFVLAPPV